MRVMTLTHLRLAKGLSQREFAAKYGLSLDRVKRVESRSLFHMRVAALQEYVEAIGGDLVLCAVTPDGCALPLTDPDPLAAEDD